MTGVGNWTRSSEILSHVASENPWSSKMENLANMVSVRGETEIKWKCSYLNSQIILMQNRWA